MKIFVNNLPFSVTESELLALFQPFGEIESVKLVINNHTGVCKGYGFVKMPLAEQAAAAIASLNAYVFKDRPLAVMPAQLGVKKAKALRQHHDAQPADPAAPRSRQPRAVEARPAVQPGQGPRQSRPFSDRKPANFKRPNRPHGFKRDNPAASFSRRDQGSGFKSSEGSARGARPRQARPFPGSKPANFKRPDRPSGFRHEDPKSFTRREQPAAFPRDPRRPGFKFGERSDSSARPRQARPFPGSKPANFKRPDRPSGFRREDPKSFTRREQPAAFPRNPRRPGFKTGERSDRSARPARPSQHPRAKPRPPQ